MAITISFNTEGVTLDETSGLQFLNSLANTAGATDADDNDVARATLPDAFADRLFVDLGLPTAFPDLVGVATGTIATVTSDSTPITGVAFDFTDGASSGFFDLDDNEIFLFHDATDPNIVLLREGNGTEADSAGAIVGAIYLDVDVDGTSTSETVDVWLVQFEAFANVTPSNPDDTLTLANLALSASSTISFDFAGAPSGSNLFMMFGDPTTTQIVVIGENPLNQSNGGNINTKDVLNISQAGSTTSFGVNGQALNDSAGHPTEGAFITYVTGATTNFLVPNLDQNEADLEQNIQFQDVVNATSASFTVNQTNPGVGPVTVKITAFSTAAEQGVNYVDGLTNDTHVNIASFSITDFVVKTGNTQFTPVASIDADGNLIITGLSTGDEVQWTTSGTHNRVLIENISAHDGISGNDNNTFDIGGFTIARAQGDSAPIPNILFDDDGPSIDPTQVATPTLTVDESIFATDASASFAGLFTAGAFGNDGPKDADNNDIADADALSYKLGISAPGAASGLTDTLTNEAVTLSVNAAGTVVTGASATGGTVFTITLNAATGLVTLDQVRAVVHDDPLDPDENTSPAQLSAANLVTLTATIIDGDLDTDTATRDIGDAFKFEDDGPSIDPTQVATPTLTVDESIFATDASASFAGLFTAGAFGNDGPKDADNNDIADADALSYKLGISAPGAASGLTDTLTNEAVTLSVNAAGTVVTGASATGGTVFTITLNAATGLVTLDQVRAVVHDDPLDPDENTSPAQLSAANLVTLTATIIDGDLDTDTATRDIGDAFKFEDDGPSIDPTQVATPTLTVDESIFATDASASFAGLFTAGAFGNDGPKDADNNDIADADALSYKLGISAPGAASGLTDTLTNEAVTLSVNAAGTVVTGASATGGTVFTITLNAATGLVTLDQVRAVVHDDPLDPDENTSPAQLSAANLVTLTATIIDGDLDTDTATRNIGDAFKFEDDGPSIDPTQVATPTLTVDESIFATDASASFAGLFTAGAFGNDGPKDADNNDIADADALSYKLGISAPGAASGLTDTLTNEAVTLSVNAAGTVVTGASATGGTVFTITLNAATGLVTLDQVRAVVHDDPLDPDENTSPAQLSAANLVTLTATIIDGDLDTDTATRDIGDAFKFEDDGPSIDPTQVATPTLTVDESIFATDASASFAGLFTAGAFGNDGPKDADNNDIADADALSYKLGISAPGAASGLTDTLTNEAVTLSVNAAGTVVTGASATGGTVFTITLNAATGLVTLDQVRAVVHDDPLDPDENTSPAQLSAANLVTLTATIIDGDLDTDTATRDIGDAFKFEDDGPSIDPTQVATPTLTVDESIFATDASASFAGLFTAGAFGNDGPKDADNNDIADADALSYKLGISAPGAASGLTDTLTNEAVTLSVNAAGTVVTGASATGGTVFTITLNAATGLVTLDQVRAVVHDDPLDPDENTSPAQLSAANLVTLTATIIDGDLDTDTATRDIGDAFKFEDDGPSIDPSAAAVPTLTVDESIFATDASASFAGLFTAGAFGNDGPKDADNNDIADADALSYKLGISAPGAASGLTDTLTNEAVTLSVNAAGTVVTGASATGGTVFTITLNAATGLVTLDQVRAVVHDDPLDPDENTSPAQLSAANLVTLTATIIDGDLDTDTATRNIGDAFKFEDDGPAVTVNDAPNGNYVAGAQGTWTDLPGADGFESLGVTFNSYQIGDNGSVPVNAALTQTDVFAFEGSILDDFNGDGTDETVDFTLTFDPDLNTYDLQVTTPPETIEKFNTSEGSLAPGGPDAVQTLLFGGSPAGDDDIVFFGVVATAPIEGGNPPPPATNDIEDLVVVDPTDGTDLTEGQIEAMLPLPGLITPGTQMNVSTSGIGVNNNNLNGANEGAGTGAFAGTTITSGDESFVINPETVVDNVRVFIDNSVSGYTPLTEDLYYTVYYTDGTTSGPTDVTNPLDVPLLDPNDEFPNSLQGHGQYFDIDAGDKQIDAVQLTMGRGVIKIPVIEFSVAQVFEPEPLHLDFTATLVDGDGDSSQDGFLVDLLV